MSSEPSDSSNFATKVGTEEKLLEHDAWMNDTPPAPPTVPTAPAVSLNRRARGLISALVLKRGLGDEPLERRSLAPQQRVETERGNGGSHLWAKTTEPPVTAELELQILVRPCSFRCERVLSDCVVFSSKFSSSVFS